jgi:tetratricopeptide (TPR) repeat protein
MEPKGNLSSYFKLCKYFISRGEYLRAKTIYESCIDKYPLDFRSYFNYAQLCCLQKQHSKALELFYKALQRNETEVIIYSSISGLLIALNMPEEALKYSCEGLILDKTNSLCWYNLNVSLRQLNRMDEAIILSWQHIACKMKSR